MTDHRTPFLVANEKETLVAFLDYVRDAIIRKASNIDENEARRALVPSGTSLLSLVKHLTSVEVGWFQLAFAGRDVPYDRNDALTEDDSREALIADYRTAIARSNEIVTECDDLDRALARPRPEGDLSLRWVLVHMIEETARHAGHADIIREQLDGSTGR